MTFEYKCVSGPMIVAVKSAKARDQAVKAFEDIMNAEAAGGWEYVGIDEFHISEPQGFFNRKRIYVPSKILVFRRMKADAVVAPPAVSLVNSAPAFVAPPVIVPVKAPEAPVVVPPTPSARQTQMPETEDTDAPKSMKAIAEKLKTARTA